jgi:hypothetical protein
MPPSQVLVRNLTNCAQMFSDRVLRVGAKSTLHRVGNRKRNPDVTAGMLRGDGFPADDIHPTIADEGSSKAVSETTQTHAFC